MVLMRETPAGVWHGGPRREREAAVKSLPLIDLCGLYVKRPQLVNGCESYLLAGHPHIMLWRCLCADGSWHWLVGCTWWKFNACLMQGDQFLTSGLRNWQVATWNGSWRFEPIAVRVFVSDGLPGQAKRATNRYEDEQCAATSKRYGLQHLPTAITYADANIIENSELYMHTGTLVRVLNGLQIQRNLRSMASRSIALPPVIPESDDELDIVFTNTIRIRRLYLSLSPQTINMLAPMNNLVDTLRREHMLYNPKFPLVLYQAPTH
eukprot:840427-Prymnesium_polylepis.2